MAFQWTNFEGAVDFVYHEVTQRGASQYKGYSFMKYAIHEFSNSEEEGYEAAWFELENAVLGRFDNDIKRFEREKEGYIKEIEGLDIEDFRSEIDEYDDYIEEVKHYKKKARKLIRPDWIRETLRG